MNEHDQDEEQGPFVSEFPYVIAPVRLTAAEGFTSKAGKPLQRVRYVEPTSGVYSAAIMPAEPVYQKGDEVNLRINLLDKEQHSGFCVSVDEDGAEIRVEKPAQERKAA